METIRQLINDNKTDEALHLLDEYIKKNDSDDEAYYLRGNVYRKMGDIRQALNNYLMAIELNPDSPAQTAYNAQIKILDFYNKDRKTRSHTDGFRRNNANYWNKREICRFYLYSSIIWFCPVLEELGK